MSLHLRYTDARRNDGRVHIKFSRRDLLWKTDDILVSPYTKQRVQGLPIPRERGLYIGPTILDMMERSIQPVASIPENLRESVADGVKAVAVWTVRKTRSLWRNSAEERKRPVKEVEDLERTRSVDHPFKTSLASGGLFVSGLRDFIEVEKVSNISISEVAYRLAVGMDGSIAGAYSGLAKMAADLWAADLIRAQELWQHIQQADGFLIEDNEISKLRPISSVSQDVERLVLRQACTWLGVDPDLECRRSRGRPSQGEAGTEGNIIRITLNADNQVSGSMKADYFGIASGVDLADLGLRRLIELLGALRSDDLEKDADLLEAYLDVVASDWREQAAAFVGDSDTTAGAPDPYEVLGVSKEATDEEVKHAYRRIMQKVHPDTSGLSRWFSQEAAAAYRTIRNERGQDVES